MSSSSSDKGKRKSINVTNTIDHTPSERAIRSKKREYNKKIQDELNIRIEQSIPKVSSIPQSFVIPDENSYIHDDPSYTIQYINITDMFIAFINAHPELTHIESSIQKLTILDPIYQIMYIIKRHNNKIISRQILLGNIEENDNIGHFEISTDEDTNVSDMTIGLEDTERTKGGGLSYILIGSMLVGMMIIDNPNSKINILTLDLNEYHMNTILTFEVIYIDCDASAGFWDRMGMKENYYFEKNNNDTTSPRSKGYGYEKRITLSDMFNWTFKKHMKNKMGQHFLDQYVQCKTSEFGPNQGIRKIILNVNDNTETIGKLSGDSPVKSIPVVNDNTETIGKLSGDSSLRNNPSRGGNNTRRKLNKRKISKRNSKRKTNKRKKTNRIKKSNKRN